MAENPAPWGEVEEVIKQAMRDAEDAHFKGYGLSTVRIIADALREADLLVSEHLKARAQAADAYARQNADVIRENMMLRDENSELRKT